MKNRKRWIVITIALVLIGAVQHVVSDRRDLEVALRIDRLPWSLRNEEVRIDNWTDYSVDGYFEANPQDMRHLLTLRPYVEVPPHPEFGYVRTPSFQFFPDLDPFKLEHLFEWEMEEPFASCRIWTNAAFTKAYVSYAVD